MIHFFRLISLWMVSILFFLPLSASLRVPVTFKPTLNYTERKEKTFSRQTDTFLHLTLLKVKELVELHNLLQHGRRLKLLQDSKAYAHSKNIEMVFESLKAIETDLIAINPLYAYECKQFSLAVQIKVVEHLFLKAHIIFIDMLNALEKHSDYWDYQTLHSNYYFLHKSPLQWFNGVPKKVEIFKNKSVIAHTQQKYRTSLGDISLLATLFDAHDTYETNIEWLKNSLSHLSQLCLQVPLDISTISEHNSFYTIILLSKALKSHNSFALKKIKSALMPSYIERNWALCTVGVCMATGAYVYMKKHPHILWHGWNKIRQLCIQNYNNHIKQPLKDVKNALFISNSELASSAQKLKTIILEVKSTPENVELLKKDYFKVCSDISKKLTLNVDLAILENKAESLDKDYLDSLWQSISGEFANSSFMEYFNFLKTSTMTKVVTAYPEMFVLIYRVNKLKGLDLGVNAAEVLIARLDELEKKLNLVTALISLFPAYFLISKTVTGLRACAHVILPKGYDDTPLKIYITKLQDLLYESYYVGNKKRTSELESERIGQLFYYTSCLEKEFKNLSEKNNILLKHLLEKFYLSDDIKGKQLYLEKMLHEYHA